MTRPEMRRAAYWLSINARALKDSHTVAGRWDLSQQEDRAAKAEYDDCRLLARKLRAASKVDK